MGGELLQEILEGAMTVERTAMKVLVEVVKGGEERAK